MVWDFTFFQFFDSFQRQATTIIDPSLCDFGSSQNNGVAGYKTYPDSFSKKVN